MGIPPKHLKIIKDTCGICLDDDNKYQVEACSTGKHAYHPECLKDWAAVNPICPECRRVLAPFYVKNVGVIVPVRNEQRESEQSISLTAQVIAANEAMSLRERINCAAIGTVYVAGAYLVNHQIAEGESNLGFVAVLAASAWWLWQYRQSHGRNF